MTKRQKWKDEEDRILEKMIQEQGRCIEWDVVSKSMLNLGFTKSSKQCRERWQN